MRPRRKSALPLVLIAGEVDVIRTVLFIVKAKFNKNKLKYLDPKSLVNINTKQPTRTIGIGYIQNQKRFWNRSDMEL